MVKMSSYIILRYRVTALLGEATLEPGKYTQIRLTVGAGTVVIGENGDEYDLKLVGAGKLKIVRPFDVEADGTTTLLLDFEADKSLKKTGQGVYSLKPVIKLAKVTTE
jgi:hypothetical protein